MLPRDLQAAQFHAYPPEARHLAIAHLELLRLLPVCFVPLLLREVIAYDWKFPAERAGLDRQFRYLDALKAGEVDSLMAPFARIHVSSDIEAVDWVNLPSQFSEKLTAHLWATHQIDNFHAAATDYVHKLDAAQKPEPLPTHRLAVVVIGQGVSENSYRLFRKLRREGVYFPRVKPRDGLSAILEVVSKRAKEHPVPFGHWYIEGGTLDPAAHPGIACVSYDSLQGVRDSLVERVTQVMQPGGKGPEYARTMLAAMRPSDVGMNEADNPVLTRFQLSLLTEGSGTQLYSTTFVQWTAREVLRRAQPLTLLARFAPRRKERTMSELLQESGGRYTLDPIGSLVDADMGAWYTWINLQRLSGSQDSRLLVWFENHSEAVATGPDLPRGAESRDPVPVSKLVSSLA
ncbi:MAG TPA: hypothetical protein VHD76_15090 [Bryobacteraceae bacterium]|nr:hypothetical protein [Bryobacteraceae bacterium]